jgi:hypothetical protein
VKFSFIDEKSGFLTFCWQILEVIGNHVFGVIGASEVRIGIRKRRWKAGSEGYLMTVTRGAWVHIQTDQISV